MQLLAFCCFEACVGAFWPSIMRMRAQHVPEDSRATILTLFRIPLNLFVCVVLYNVRMLMVHGENRRVEGCAVCIRDGSLRVSYMLKMPYFRVPSAAAGASMQVQLFPTAAMATFAPVQDFTNSKTEYGYPGWRRTKSVVCQAATWFNTEN